MTAPTREKAWSTTTSAWEPVPQRRILSRLTLTRHAHYADPQVNPYRPANWRAAWFWLTSANRWYAWRLVTEYKIVNWRR